MGYELDSVVLGHVTSAINRSPLSAVLRENTALPLSPHGPACAVRNDVNISRHV